MPTTNNVHRLLKNGGQTLNIDYWTRTTSSSIDTGTITSYISVGGMTTQSTYNLVGSVDEVRLYSTALSDNELIALKNNQLLVVPNTNLEAYYIFEAPTIDTRLVYDHSTKGRHLNIQGNALYEFDSTLCRPVYETNCAGTQPEDGYYKFTSNTQSITSSGTVSITNNLSFSVWLRRTSTGGTSRYAFSVGSSATYGVFHIGFRATNTFVFGFGAADYDVGTHTELTW
jgi:hypothetical protein